MSGLSFEDANPFHRFMRTFAATRVGVAVLRPTAHHLDRLVTKVSGGRSSFAELATGVPVVMVTSTGARSGASRTSAVYGIPHPDGLSLIASNFGGAKHPAWYYNLKAKPMITVEVGSQRFTALAAELDDPARAELWPELVSRYPTVGEHQARTGRQIPVLMLTRQD